MTDQGDAVNTPSVPPPFWRTRAFRFSLAGLLALLLLTFGVFTFYYARLARQMDAKLRRGPFSDTVNIYAAPETVEVGDRLDAEQLIAGLRQAGFSTSRSDPMGWYNQRPDAVEIFPGAGSYAAGESAVLSFRKGRLTSIVSLRDNTTRNEYTLAPALIANISDKAREKRRLVSWGQLPPALIHAVVSTEDKHFFNHSGFDMLRILKAAYVDVKEGRKEQGASTLSMQLARGLWLTPDKRWKRKAAELLMTLHLEERLSKQQIFEYYSNQVYLGRRGSFSINGFGEGARVFFGKDLDKLTVPEAATLAGMVQRPGYYNPIRYPERARERRNLVLSLMRQNNYLSEQQYRDAAASPMTVAQETEDTLDSDAAYFVDLVNQDLQDRFGDDPARTAYVYTTLDARLQRAAVEAVNTGMASVDKLLSRRRKKGTLPAVRPQVALVALDPQTGEVKALVGGRNYASSQLNRALAQRQPGSVFKPFVYAAALDTAVEGGPKILTAATTVVDEPTTFSFDGKTYAPGNFRGEFMGPVSLRTALAHSLNVATVKVAEEVGYSKVAELARRCGLESVQSTPAAALGSYDASPLQIAGAYTVFANQGMAVEPALVSLVRGTRGTELYRHTPEPRRALDPRVAYLVTNLMEGVLNYGTGAGVRARGFTLPAAGKTGTSHDGWFAGFTSELLTVVWVGYDDNRELNLEGARSALPVWTEFMKQAARLRDYRNAEPFEKPKGIVDVQICDQSGQLATTLCPITHTEEFIDGTQPVAECTLHPGSGFADRLDQSVLEPLPAASR